jgi:predicted phosphodiesterase
MRTLVISDLHLGARSGRDVLRRPVALRALLDALVDVDRLVLLGDTIELLEGRPKPAMHATLPVLHAIGARMGRDREVVVVLGNHDHALVRPWLRTQRRRHKRIGLASRVPASSSEALKAITDALKPARTQVRYPGVWLGDGVWATHGHYLDRHLFPAGSTGVFLGRVPEGRAGAEDYEAAAGPSAAAVQGLVAASLPGLLGEPLDRAAGLARSASITVLPLAAKFLGGGTLAPLSAGALGFQFRRAGLPAMAEVALRLNVRAEHVIFGHLHRAGPRYGDHVPEWAPRDRQALTNSGCWVYEPLLLAGAHPPHPYWPGGAVLVEDGVAPVAIGLLDGLTERELG